MLLTHHPSVVVHSLIHREQNEQNISMSKQQIQFYYSYYFSAFLIFRSKSQLK